MLLCTFQFITSIGEREEPSRKDYIPLGSANLAGSAVNDWGQCKQAPSQFANNQTQRLAKLQGRRKYVCNICGAVFGTYGGRYYHMASHTGKFKYNCDLCDKGFMKTDAYRNHIAMHRKQIQGK